MRTHIEDPYFDGKSKVIVAAENKKMRNQPDNWDIFLFPRTLSHLEYFNSVIRSVLEDPTIIAGGELYPKGIGENAPNSLFVHAGSLDNAGLTFDGLGVRPETFNAHKSAIEAAIDQTLAKIRADRKKIEEKEKENELLSGVKPLPASPGIPSIHDCKTMPCPTADTEPEKVA